MNLELFHHKHRPNAYYGIMDRRNSKTGAICYYFELIGWYDSNLAMRLLGHYRLFNLCKARQAMNYLGLSPEFGYIVRCQENNILTNTWVQLIQFMKSSNRPEDHREIKRINEILLYKRPEILQNFLVAAQTDFEKALLETIEQIQHPAFLSTPPITNVHFELTENHQHNNSYSKNELHIHPEITKEAPPPKTTKGKEEGVFSKKQVLILLDLLAKAKLIEPIDFKRSNKYPAIAQLLRALTGRGEDTWIEELDKYETKGLYHWELDGQRDELIRILTNIAEKFADAGFDTIARLADKKIRELRR